MADNLTPSQQAKRRAEDMRATEYRKMFIENEGLKDKVYEDTKGNRTIGIGFNLEDKNNQKVLADIGLDLQEVLGGKKLKRNDIIRLYNHSLRQAFSDAQKFDPGFARRPEPVKKSIVDMAFNLGLTKLNKFEKMKAALGQNDYSRAADEMVDSNWYKQVKSRGPRTVALMRSVAK